jgi:hypothetical protein
MLFNLSFPQLVFICAILIIAIWLCYHNIGKLHKLYLDLESRFSRQNNKIEEMNELYTNLSQTIIKKAEEEEENFLKNKEFNNNEIENNILSSLDNFIDNDESKELLKSLMENDSISNTSTHDEPEHDAKIEEIEEILMDNSHNVIENVVQPVVEEVVPEVVEEVVPEVVEEVVKEVVPEDIVEKVMEEVKDIKITNKKDKTTKSKAKVVKENAENAENEEPIKKPKTNKATKTTKATSKNKIVESETNEELVKDENSE